MSLRSYPVAAVAPRGRRQRSPRAPVPPSAFPVSRPVISVSYLERPVSRPGKTASRPVFPVGRPADAGVKSVKSLAVLCVAGEIVVSLRKQMQRMRAQSGNPPAFRLRPLPPAQLSSAVMNQTVIVL